MARIAPPHPRRPRGPPAPGICGFLGFAAFTLRKRVVGSPPDSAGGTRRREDRAKQRGWPGEGGAWLVGGAKSGRGRGHRRGFQRRLRRPRPTPSGCRGRPESAVLRTSRHVRGEEPEEVGAQGSPGGSREAERGREERRGAGRWKRGLGGPPDRREPAVAGHVPGPGLVSGREAARAPSPAPAVAPLLSESRPGPTRLGIHRSPNPPLPPSFAASVPLPRPQTRANPAASFFRSFPVTRFNFAPGSRPDRSTAVEGEVWDEAAIS